MPGPCVQLLSGASHCCNQTNKRNRLNSNSIKKIRLICYDPDATDSSSDDEESCGFKKRIVEEINIPNSSSPSVSAETEASCQGSNNGERPMSLKKKKKVLDKPTRESSGSKAYCSDDSYASTTSEMNGGHERGSESVDATMDARDEEEIQIQLLDFVSVDDQFHCIDAAREGINLQMELDSLFVNDYGEVFDDLTVFNDLPICEFDGLDRAIDLPGFDFDLGKEELAWIEEPLNIACCP